MDIQWLNDLTSESSRGKALWDLSNNRKSFPNLAPMLWEDKDKMALVLEEVRNVHPSDVGFNLTANQLDRVIGALNLLQCVVAHPETRPQFLAADLLPVVFPYLRIKCCTSSGVSVQLAALGVIETLVTVGNGELIPYLLSKDCHQLFLNIMKECPESCALMATCLMQKILLDDNGLFYITRPMLRIIEVINDLENVVISQSKEPSARVLKHLVGCYLRLSDHIVPRSVLSVHFPEQLLDGTFTALLQEEDPSTMASLTMLLEKMRDPHTPTQ